ncbi:MAG: DUF86 domain-containing protein [Gemmatimonadales bacterium]|nr:DUF86 domain-containing protein [Gemmatimonadales bacterium]MDZ4389325.1 DUF86 domain-containing protein [Gemmatimonadales bacterium]
MNRTVPLLLGELVDAAELVARYTAGLTFDDFAASIEKQDAVVRRLAVIGEAVKGLPESFRSRHPEIPWRSIAGARDVLVHEYFRVDLELAWEMVQHDLPELARNVRSIIAAEGFADGGAL